MERHRKKVENFAESNVSFPTKLYALMVNENGTSVEWLPHGFAFKISDQNAFLQHIIPKYFRHTKLTSFQRQLNLYGFRRVLKGDDEGAYFHPKFQRGKKDLINDIQRLPSKQSLMSLQDVMDEYSQPSFQLNSASKKKKSSPPAERTRGRGVKKTESSKDIPMKEDNEDAEDDQLEVTAATTTFSVPYVRTNPRPKRTLTPSASSAFTASSSAAPRAVAPRYAPPPSPPSESTSSAADDESSVGVQRGRRGRPPARNKNKNKNENQSKGKSSTAKPDFADTPVSPLSFAASPTTQVPGYKESAYPTHDDYLDLSLTSPLFSASEMLEAMPPRSSRSNAALPSPTSHAAATAQADFGSNMVHSQHAADFAGLSNQQDDLAWTQHYSLGALGSLPLITDYSPRGSGSTPADPSRSASSSTPPDQEDSVAVCQAQGEAQSHLQWQPSSGAGMVGMRDAFDDLLDFFVPLASSQDAALLAAPSTSFEASSSSSGYSALPPAMGLPLFQSGVSGAHQEIHTPV